MHPESRMLLEVHIFIGKTVLFFAALFLKKIILWYDDKRKIIWYNY